MFTRRNVFIAALLLIAAFFYFKNPSDKTLPTGSINGTQTPVEISDISEEPITGKPQVELETTKGKIVVELRPDLAPKTVANFLGLWSRGECNGLIWHRVEDWVVQGCDPKGNGTGGKSSLPTELSEANFSAGSLGVARLAYPKDVSNNSQFFITKTDSSFLNNEYTYFGKVISGMDVINNLTQNDKITQTTILSK